MLTAQPCRLLYIPVPEYFDLSAAEGASNSQQGRISRLNAGPPGPRGKPPGNYASALGLVDVLTELGPVTTHFLGPCLWADDQTFEYWVESCRVEVPAWNVKFTVRRRRRRAAGGPV